MLQVEGIAAGYGGLEVLHELSLRVDHTEIVSLLGANGAGKTTFLRALSGLIPLTRGRIVFAERDISRLAAHRRVALGLVQVPEGRHILGELSVRENLLLGGYAHRHDQAHLDATRERVYALFPILRERTEQPAGSLSGGEQQMLAIGRALMARPRLLLLDEPSLGLAPQIVSQIFAVIHQLRAEGMPILLVEQNVKKALEIADRGLVLRRGRVVLGGTAAELLASDEVRHAYLGGG